jgi:hypothetical protein
LAVKVAEETFATLRAQCDRAMDKAIRAGLGLTMGLKFYTIKLKDRIGLGSGFVSIHF